MNYTDQTYAHCMSQDAHHHARPQGAHVMLNQQDITPYIFHYPSWGAKPETFVIHQLSDVIPQAGDGSAMLENKEHLLYCLVEHVGFVKDAVRTQEYVQVLAKLVATLQDEATFKRLLAEEDFFLDFVHSDIVTAVLPPPQTGVVTIVDKESWTRTITTLERLQKWSRDVHKGIQRVKERYQQIFAALCYLECQGELPVDMQTLDVKHILQRKHQALLNGPPKEAAAALFTFMENAQRGWKRAELMDLTQTTNGQVNKLLLVLETQDKVYKDTPAGERGHTFYAVSPATLKDKRLPSRVEGAIKQRLLHQGHEQLTVTPAHAFQVLAQEGHGCFTRKDIERVLTSDYTTILLREDLDQLLSSLEDGGQLVPLETWSWYEKDQYYLNIPAGKDALHRDIAAADDGYTKQRLQACLQRLEQKPSEPKQDDTPCLPQDGVMETDTTDNGEEPLA
jgi:hypothetical protein